MRRPRDGANTRCCSATDRRAKSGRTSTLARVRPPRERAPQQVAGLADLALARQEHEDVAGPLAPQLLGRVDDRLLERLLVVGLLVAAGDRAVADVDRIQAPRHLDHRRRRVRAAEVPREARGVERRRRDDDLAGRAGASTQLLQVAEQEVDVEAALVRLVDDDRVVGGEVAVALRLGEQDAVGHQLDVRVGLRLVGEAHLVADRLADARAELLRDARRDRARGDAPRLRVADQPALAAAGGEADLRAAASSCPSPSRR